MTSVELGTLAVDSYARLDDCALDLLREQLRGATTEFHLERTLHDLANHFHAIELRVTFLEAEQRASSACPSVLEEVVHSCTSARQRIDSLRDEQPSPPWPPERVDLSAIIARVAALTVRDGGVVALAPAIGSLPWVCGVELELSIALLHLFDNAREAGGRLRVDGVADDQLVTLSVSDDGGGIPEELRSKIWKPFFTTKGVGHRGHGLALVQQLLRRSGGIVQLESSGQGACFVLRLAR